MLAEAMARYNHQAGGFIGLNILDYVNLRYSF
jgi:hypothetical protein